MRLRHRIRVLEGRAAARIYDPWARWREEYRRERDRFLSHIPPDLRTAVDAAFDADATTQEDFTSLMSHPFARWAPPMAADYQFPRALIEWMLNPPRAFWMGHNCERCGLTVPLYTTWANDPDPPPSVVAFPTCPACGGTTSHKAS